MQPCREADGEIKPNSATAVLSLPGFSSQQVDSLSKLFSNILSDPISTYQMSIFIAVPGSHLKHKRNVKTREQYKKKAKAKAQAHVTVQVQEAEYTQEVEHTQEVKHSVRIIVEKSGKHVFLQSWNWVTTSPQHAAVISYIEMASFNRMILVQNRAICIPRRGVG